MAIVEPRGNNVFYRSVMEKALCKIVAHLLVFHLRTRNSPSIIRPQIVRNIK